jgi:SAM-dependent methyltransferase
VLVLYLELACIRWFPAHVLFLTFFTNTVLLAAFLGMSVGCLLADRRRDLLPWTPAILVVALFAAHAVELERRASGRMLDVGHQSSPQLVFFGVEYQSGDPSTFVVPMEAVCGFFFLVIALVLVGPGQRLGRALARLPNRVEAYTVNVAGSIAGIALFSACSWWQLAPVWWFTLSMAGVVWCVRPRGPRHGLAVLAGSLLVIALASWRGENPVTPDRTRAIDQYWSPYYRIDYARDSKVITVNLIGHQQMISREAPAPAYSLPYLLNRDAGRPAFQDILIIGAGSGNDVSRALEWGAERVDAVEIDPVIYRLGLANHPDRPYEDRRVTVHLDDGRNYLRSTTRRYDLIVYALVDSLVLHSSYSNIRLESYLFTRQAFEDVRRRLKPGGVFAMYNYFRQGWIVARLRDTLEETFGTQSAVVVNLPSRESVGADQVLYGDFTLLFAGGTGPIRRAFAQRREYWLPAQRRTGPRDPDGFEFPPPADREAWRGLPDGAPGRDAWLQFRPTAIIAGSEPLRPATDDWPFLYVRRPMIPGLSLRGAAIMGAIALLLLLPVLARRASTPGASEGGRGPAFGLQMFCLGAGFMLIETKAVVHMALLFGSTWVVNSVVFFAVLAMILLANLFVHRARPSKPGPYYAGLFLALAANALIPMDSFLGMDRTLQMIASSALAFAPILFAGVVFAMSFARAAEPDRAFGLNIAGAMFGGLAEYSSMLLGFRLLLLVPVVLYALSLAGDRASRSAVIPAQG